MIISKQFMVPTLYSARTLIFLFPMNFNNFNDCGIYYDNKDRDIIYFDFNKDLYHYDYFNNLNKIHNEINYNNRFFTKNKKPITIIGGDEKKLLKLKLKLG